MGAVKRYFSNEFQWRMFTLQHEAATDFYLSPWQKNTSALPLFLIRLILFVGSLGILVSSLVFTGLDGSLGYWAIYLTNWGVVSLPVVTCLAFAVSFRAYFYGEIDSSTSLPWYIKLYWVSYNVAIPIAFLITVFYWSLLADLDTWGDVDIEYAPNVVLDVFIHGINSAVMFLLLMTSRQPLRFLHGYMPVVFALIYSLFAGVYYLAGGTDSLGNQFIYPMIDWSDPGPTSVAVLLTFVLFFFIHLVVVGLVAVRDSVARCCVNQKSISISEDKC